MSAACPPALLDPTRKYDALGVLARYAYDADGRMVAVVVDAPLDPQNPTGLELALTTAYDFDASGRLIQTVTDPDDGTGPPELHLVTRYEYDAAGRLWMVVVDPGDPQVTGDGLELTTTYQYDAAGRLTGQGQPDGSAWTYAYDEVGRLVRSTDPVGHVTEYQYDRAGRRTAVEVDPDDGSGVPDLDLTTAYQYDAAGRLVETIDPSGVRTVHAYDRAGRLTSTTVDPDDGAGPAELELTTTYAYTASGDLISVTDAEGYVTTYAYDHAGRLVSVTRPGGRVTGYAYDASGRTIENVTDEGVVTQSAYDITGRATAVTVEPDDGIAPAELNLVTAYQYDAAGRRTGVTNPRGFTTAYAFDAAGRLTSLTDAATPTPGVVSFSYDAASRATRVVNARGYGSDFAYDALGRVTHLEDPLDRVEERVYNGLGQIVSREDPNGNALVYAYDGANRLTEIAPAAGGVVYASFGYDAVGRQTGASNPTGSLSSAYDAAGRLTQVGSPQGTVGYQHDGIGRRTSMTQTPAGGAARTVGYAYDPTTGDLAGITDWNAQTTAYQFTDDGRLYSVARPNGVTSLHNYDSAGRLTAISHLDAVQQPLAEYGYVLDANGNRVRLDVTGSAVTNGVEGYAYDALDRLTSATYPTGSATYAYDANGNRTSVTSGGQTTIYVYDDADQLQELRDGSGALLVDLGYDGNGNRVSADTDTYVYDWANRLTQATVGGTNASFAYLVDGARASKTSGTTTPYLYDRAAGLPEVVDDGASGFVHGPGGLGAEVGGSTTWALPDGLGSVRARANSAGAVVGTTDWDAFGNVRASSGSTGAFGWAGEQTDPETGFTYLRSRYYSPGVGRFLTPDVLAQSGFGTQGFNRYAYAGNNPATLTDPSGYAAGLAGLGQAIAGAFWYVAAVLDCYLQGECRYQRKHGDGGGSVGLVRSDTLLESGFPGDDWPGVPEPDRPWDPELPEADDLHAELSGSILCRWENIFCGPGGGRGQGGGGRGGGGIGGSSGGSGQGSRPAALQNLLNYLRGLEARPFRKFLESMESQASVHGKALRPADETRVILDEALSVQRGYSIYRVDAQNTGSWRGGPHIDLKYPDVSGKYLHFPIPPGFVP